MPLKRSIVLAVCLSLGCLTQASAQIAAATKIGDRQNCGHLTNPGMAARIGTMALNDGNMRAMLQGSRDGDLGMICASYVARNKCSAEWADASISSLNAVGLAGRRSVAGSALGLGMPDMSRDGAPTGAVAGGVLGAMIGNSMGRGMTNDSALGGLLGGSIVGAIGAVTGAATGAAHKSQKTCKDLSAAMSREIGAMINARALYPVRTDAELRGLMVNWRARLSDPARIRTFDAILAQSDAIAGRVHRNAAGN